MKIIMSRSVLEESHKVCSEITQLIIPGFPAMSLEDQLEMSRAEYGMRKNINMRVDHDGGVEFEMADEVVIAVLRLYGRFAGVINAVVQTVKVMIPMLKADFNAVNQLIEERR